MTIEFSTPASNTSSLFQPIKVGNLHLNHRVVLAPLTRLRASDDHVPLLPAVRDYYQQRGNQPGTLLISEATFIAPEAGGEINVPGIWNAAQIAAWKEVVDAVHGQGSHIYLQLWALGRTANPSVLASEGLSLVSASDIPLSSQKDHPPRALTIDQIKEYVQLYATAASNAVYKAGFDGVEIHGANGYLIDQFLQDVTNIREDAYGGNVEKRARFGLEVVDAVVEAVGEEKTGIRVSPWGHFNEMGMSDPVPTFSYFVSQIASRYSSLSYIHVVEPRVHGFLDRDPSDIGKHESNDFLRKIWGSRPFISAGGYTRDTAIAAADKADNELVAFGRRYIPNPDLPLRLKNDTAITPYDRSTFYVPGDASGRGYSDYAFAEENRA